MKKATPFLLNPWLTIEKLDWEHIRSELEEIEKQRQDFIDEKNRIRRKFEGMYDEKVKPSR